MLRWLMSNYRVLMCMFLVMLSSIPLATADPPTDDMWGQIALKIQTQNPNLRFDRQLVITEAATAPYRELFPMRIEYNRLRIHPNVGASSRLDTWEVLVGSSRVNGVLFGRPPTPIGGAGKIEPLGIPKFEYKLLEPQRGKSRRVALKFGLADDTEIEIEVNAAVITPMTAAALDGRLTLFTALKNKGAAIHPALEGHRLAYRPAVTDGFPFTGNFLLLKRLSEKTEDALFQEILQNAKLDNIASVLIEKEWTLSKEHLTLREITNDPSSSILEFIVREHEKVQPFAVSRAVNHDVFKSLTKTEQQLLREHQEAVFIGRIVYGARNGWIINFDKGRNWVKMIEELAPVYKGNLVNNLDAATLHREMTAWANAYQDEDTDQKLPEDFKLR